MLIDQRGGTICSQHSARPARLGVADMAEFGVCENLQCELSYGQMNPGVLLGRIMAFKKMEQRGSDIAGMLPYVKTFSPYFQFRQDCAKCGQFLYRITQPTADLQTESDEYIRRSKLNALLDAGYQLQAWGVLPPAA